MKVLIIDDDITFLCFYEKTLNKDLQDGDELFVTPDSKNFLEIVRTKAINLVITDLIMPQKSGLEVLKETKEYDPLIEVIVVTGEGSIDTAVQAMSLGARDFLTKPLNRKLILERLNNIREILTRRAEAEEYRIAKETIESSSAKSISELQLKIANYITAVQKIKKCILASQNVDTTLVQDILEIIDIVEKDN